MLTNCQKSKIDDAIRTDYEWLIDASEGGWDDADPTNTDWSDMPEGATVSAVSEMDGDDAGQYADEKWGRLARIYRRGGLESDSRLDLKAAERKWNDISDPTKSGRRFASSVAKVVTAAMSKRQRSEAEAIDSDDMRHLSRIGIPVSNVRFLDHSLITFESPFHRGSFWITWHGSTCRWGSGGCR